MPETSWLERTTATAVVPGPGHAEWPGLCVMRERCLNGGDPGEPVRAQCIHDVARALWLTNRVTGHRRLPVLRHLQDGDPGETHGDFTT